MGLFDFLKKKFQADVPNALTVIANTTPSSKLSYIDKERIIVERITTRDMHQFSNMPYQWNSKVKKSIQPYGHPFAYMDIIGQNIAIAKSELSKMNKHLSADSRLSHAIPKNISIPIQDIVFSPLKEVGYTRLMCTPFTFTGQISKYPISLSFMTDLRNSANTTHGDLFYGQDGEIKKATIYCWRKHGGAFFYYDTVDNELVLSRVEIPDMSGQQNVIYKGKHILYAEAQRNANACEYKWIQNNLPDLCPKSFSGYSRMKNANTKNFQKIVAEAAKLGYEVK